MTTFPSRMTSSSTSMREGPQPRIIRFRDAPRYLGMDRHRFNVEVRPHLTEIPIDDQGVGFDRHDLDAWVDEYKRRNGRPARKADKARDANAYRDSSYEQESGPSTSPSLGGELAEAPGQIREKVAAEHDIQ